MKARFIFTLLAITIVPAQVLAGQDDASATLPPDLAAVPADAIGFVHVRVADIWKSDSLKEVRETVMKAGAKALEGFDKRFLPAPSSIDRLTFVVVPHDGELQTKDPAYFAILSINKPVDQNEFLKSTMPDAAEKKTTNGSYWVDAKLETAVSFVNERMIVFGTVAGVQSFVEKRSGGPGPLSGALHAANSTRQITVGANLSLLPAKELHEAPAFARPLLLAKTAMLSFDLHENAQIDLHLNFADEKAAVAGLTAVQNLAKEGREDLKESREKMLKTVLGDGKPAPLEKLPESAMALLALGGMERLDAFLADLPVKRDRQMLRLSTTMPSISYAAMAPMAMGMAMFLPQVRQVRTAASRASSINNLKQIGLAMQNYHDANGTLPPTAICDKNGKPLLSWRVAILPYMGQNDLYKQFKLDEPWDSEHNKKLSAQMPPIYVNPRVTPPTPGMTNFRVFYGKDTALDLQKSLPLSRITDGASNTMMAFEAAESVPWTKPEEFAYDKKKPLPEFFGDPSGFFVLLCDGSVHVMPQATEERTMRQIIEATDGQAVVIP